MHLKKKKVSKKLTLSKLTPSAFQHPRPPRELVLPYWKGFGDSNSTSTLQGVFIGGFCILKSLQKAPFGGCWHFVFFSVPLVRFFSLYVKRQFRRHEATLRAIYTIEWCFCLWTCQHRGLSDVGFRVVRICRLHVDLLGVHAFCLHGFGGLLRVLWFHVSRLTFITFPSCPSCKQAKRRSTSWEKPEDPQTHPPTTPPSHSNRIPTHLKIKTPSKCQNSSAIFPWFLPLQKDFIHSTCVHHNFLHRIWHIHKVLDEKWWVKNPICLDIFCEGDERWRDFVRFCLGMKNGFYCKVWNMGCSLW